MPVIVSYSLEGSTPVTLEFGELRYDGIDPAHTQVDLLSITKSLTAVAILKLVEQSRLEVDDEISEHLEGVPEDKNGITIHQLLTHSSGLLASCGSDHYQIQKHGLLKCAFDSQLLSTPGSEYSYSNVGYSVLAAIVEVRSGKSFESFLLDDVFADLGLHHTGYGSAIDGDLSIRSEDKEPLQATSWGGQKAFWNLIRNGGLVSTPTEFLKIRQSLRNGDIIPLDLLEQAQSGYIPEDETGATYYGYGVVLQDNSSVGPLIWHNGGSESFSSEWNYLRDLDLEIFVAGYPTDGADAYEAIDIFRSHLRD